MYRVNRYPVPASTRRWKSIFLLLFLLISLRSFAQVTDSADYPVLWLRADSGVGSGWKDFTGHGYDGVFFGSGPRKTVTLNYNPALWFNGTDDSVRVPVNLDSLSEMTYMAVFVPADNTEELIWGTGGAVLRNTLMTTQRVTGPGGNTDTVASVVKTPALATVLQTWQLNDSVAPSPSAYLMVGSVGQSGSIPAFQGMLAELLVFDRSLDVLTQVQYETYLAIKYGIPLTKGNYVSAGQTVLWDAAKNKDFCNRIAGLGRENYFTLYQKTSISAVDADSLLVIGTADTIAGSNYLLWGDNNKSLSFSATTDGQLQLLNRQWLMSASGPSANRLNTTVRISRKPIDQGNYWLVVNPGGYTGYPVDSLLYYFADNLPSDSPFVYRNIHWDADRSGKDGFALAQARDLLLKLTILDSASCSAPFTGRARMQAIGGQGPYTYRVTNSAGQTVTTGVFPDSATITDIGDLARDNYSIVLMDGKGHVSLRSLTLPVPAAQTLTLALEPSQTLPAGGELLFDASKNIPSGQAQSYQWASDNGFQSTLPSITVREPGVYTVAVTSVAGCVFRDTVTVSGEAGQQVVVYPTPSTDGNFTVSVSLPVAGDVAVTIYDLSGNKQQELNGHNNTEHRLNGHISTPGLYMVSVKTAQGVESRKLLIL